jgi:hypothetical protein
MRAGGIPFSETFLYARRNLYAKSFLISSRKVFLGDARINLEGIQMKMHFGV